MVPALGLDRLLAGGKTTLGSVRPKHADAAPVANTIDSAENEETYENRPTVKRHGG